MSKAEERALEAYPKMSRASEPHGLIPADNKSHYLGDGNEEKREGFIVGYHQAEKDLELTWEDIKLLDKIFMDEKIMSGLILGKKEYEEILKRFKENR
jgi:hypothetical protein